MGVQTCLTYQIKGEITAFMNIIVLFFLSQRKIIILVIIALIAHVGFVCVHLYLCFQKFLVGSLYKMETTIMASLG